MSKPMEKVIRFNSLRDKTMVSLINTAFKGERFQFPTGYDDQKTMLKMLKGGICFNSLRDKAIITVENDTIYFIGSFNSLRDKTTSTVLICIERSLSFNSLRDKTIAGEDMKFRKFIEVSIPYGIRRQKNEGILTIHALYSFNSLRDKTIRQ